MQWMQETPQAVVEALMASLPRLDAEEQLVSANVVALGTKLSWSVASLKGGFRKLRERAAPRRAARKAQPGDLPVGIGYRSVSRG